MNLVPTPFVTFADVLQRLGNVPAARVLLQPPPGTATEKDVLRHLDAADKRLCELVDGTLVEKAPGLYESALTVRLLYHLQIYLGEDSLGFLLGADGALRILKGLVRIPSISFIAWTKLPGGKLPKKPIPALAPNLAVEVLRKGNPPGEVKRKVREYFQAGVALVWLVQPKNRTIRVHTAATQSVLLHEADTLDGGAGLPGFALPIRKLFSGRGQS